MFIDENALWYLIRWIASDYTTLLRPIRLLLAEITDTPPIAQLDVSVYFARNILIGQSDNNAPIGSKNRILLEFWEYYSFGLRFPI